jgi:hypothetical protein
MERRDESSNLCYNDCLNLVGFAAADGDFDDNDAERAADGSDSADSCIADAAAGAAGDDDDAAQS